MDSRLEVLPMDDCARPIRPAAPTAPKPRTASLDDIDMITDKMLFVPHYLPNGYKLSSSSVMVASVVYLGYSNPERPEEHQTLHVCQADKARFPVNKKFVQATRLNGRSAYVVEGEWINDDGASMKWNSEASRSVLCEVAKDRIAFVRSAGRNRLDRGTLLEVADSLHLYQ